MTVRRFYKQVATGDGHTVLLDGRSLKTPLGAVLALPSARLTDAVAEEWRAKGEVLKPAAMTLTRLANTAIDRIAVNRTEAEGELLAFAGHDLLCYRADSPVELVNRQARTWDPLLDLAASRYGARLTVGTGIATIAQPPEALAALSRVLTTRTTFALSGMATAAAITGSAVMAVLLADNLIDGDAAMSAAHLDAIFQAEKWGQDAEAAAVYENKRRELLETTRFLQLLPV